MQNPSANSKVAVIFDMDGVLTDTTELHYQGWQRIADELGAPFDRAGYEPLRGLGRMESLELLLGPRAARFTDEQKKDLAARKNVDFLERVARLTPADLLPGARELLEALRARGVPIALASSSRNAEAVIARLGIRAFFKVFVDANQVPRSKPDPAVFLEAANRLHVPPARCVVIEDAASGVAAALAAGMKVVGLGPPERVGGAQRVVERLSDVGIEMLLNLLA